MIQVLYVLFHRYWQEYVRPYLINQKVGSIIHRIDKLSSGKVFIEKTKNCVINSILFYSMGIELSTF